MRAVLIASYTRPYALGLRHICACLKAAGHSVQMIFMSSPRDGSTPDYNASLLRDFVARARQSDVIGLSLMTNSFHRACALTSALREAEVSVPIVWGGVHATIAPEECLEHADAVCVGEGEESMVSLVQAIEKRETPTDTPGMSFRAGGLFGNRNPIRNPAGPLNSQLDDLPLADYDLDTHWVADRDRLVPACPANLRGALHAFSIITARGCPYHCTYCNNEALRRVYAEKERWVRMRSLAAVLSEIEQRRASFPSIREIHFVDDLFFVHPAEEIEDFTDRYARTVGLPLLLQVSPNTVTDRKVRALLRVPIKRVLLGIQSGSEDTLRNIYHRSMPPAQIAEAMDTLAQYGLPMEHHYIISNPYEPEANVIETMRFVASHHRHAAKIYTFPLMLFPGTPLYDRARSDGWLAKRRDLAYDHEGSHATWLVTQDYLTTWLRIILGLRNAGVSSRLAHRVIDLATSRTVRRALDRRWFGPVMFVAQKGGRKVFLNLLFRPAVRTFRYLRGSPRVPRPLGDLPQDACAAGHGQDGSGCGGNAVEPAAGPGESARSM